MIRSQNEGWVSCVVSQDQSRQDARIRKAFWFSSLQELDGHQEFDRMCQGTFEQLSNCSYRLLATWSIARAATPNFPWDFEAPSGMGAAPHNLLADQAATTSLHQDHEEPPNKFFCGRP
ncbi:hypothetical protein RJZ56_001183 [Blastomyces dermatitidis]